MTFRLVTVADAKANLRVLDADLDATDFAGIVEDASAIVMDYLAGSAALAVGNGWTDSNGELITDSTGDPATDSNGDSVVPKYVRRATLLVIGALYENREGQTDPLTPAVVSILRRTRDPSFA